MQHIAILKKSWNLLDKILSGEKTIESRWYKNKSAPWNKIKENELVYFKDSGSPVTIKTEVDKVLQFQNLTPRKVKQLLNKYDKAIGIKTEDFYEQLKNKNYCLLIFLKNPETIVPFDIDKTGFGLMSAWICVDDIERIKKKTNNYLESFLLQPRAL